MLDRKRIWLIKKNSLIIVLATFIYLRALLGGLLQLGIDNLSSAVSAHSGPQLSLRRNVIPNLIGNLENQLVSPKTVLLKMI